MGEREVFVPSCKYFDGAKVGGVRDRGMVRVREFVVLNGEGGEDFM
jgi:hypothetical protein